MWYTMGLLCGLLLALLVRSPQADVQCDGIDDVLTPTLNLGAFVAPTTFTIAGWINSTGSTFANDNCWGNGPFVMDTSEVIALGRNGTTGTGNSCTYVYSGSNHLITSPSLLSGGWHHLAARLSAGVLELFADGVSQGTVGAGNIADLTGLLQLCGAPDGHSPDRITQVLVYDTALSNAQIEGLALSRLRGAHPGSPIAFWPLDDCGDGVSGHNVVFTDRAGSTTRNLTGTNGPIAPGLTCMANGYLSHGGGVQ